MDNQHGNPLYVMDEYFGSMAYSIGAMLGDGCVKAYMNKDRQKLLWHVRISNMDLECIERVCCEVNSLFGTDYQPRPYMNENGTQMYDMKSGKDIIYKFFRYFVGDKITLHDGIFRADRASRIDFIAGLFDTDGWVEMTKVPKEHISYGYRWKVGYAARHRTLVEDVARLLQKLGVKVGKVTEHQRKEFRTIYSIHPNIRSFMDAGCYFLIRRKAERLELYEHVVSGTFRDYNAEPVTTG